MADTTSLTNFLNDVASAIKAKTGDSTAIPASQFDTKIRSIPTGGTYETITRTISENGNVTLLPSQGYDAIDRVNLTINVSGGGQIPVKLFANEQAMHADPSPSMGDLALVYGDSTGPWTQSTQASTLTFPRTVTLASAYTGNLNSSFRAVNSSNMFYGDVQLNSSSFYFSIYTEDVQGEVYYTSSDGITYTREEGEDTYDIGFDIYCPYRWDDILGNFIQTGSKYFGGVFEYDMRPDRSVLPVYTPVANTTTSTGELTLSDRLPVSTFNSFVQAIETYTGVSYREMNLYMTSSKDKIVGYGYINDNSLYSMSEYITKYNNNWYLTGYSHKTATAKRYEYDIQTGVVTDSNWVTAMSIPVYSSQTQPQMLLQETYVLPTVGRNNGAISSLNYIYVSYCENTANPLYTSPNFNTRVTPTYPDKADYWTAKTQLTLDDANQLLPGKIGYGNNGLLTGDDTIYNNLDATKIYEKYYGFVPSNIDLYTGINKYDTDLILSKNTNTNSSTFNNKTYPIKLKKYVTKSDIKAFSFERQKIKLDDTQIMALLDDMDFATLSGETYFYTYHEVFANDDCTTIGVWCTHLTSKMYIIDTVNKTIITSFKCYDCNIVKNKLMYMKERFTYNSSDIYVYCYDLTTRTETRICELPIGSINRSSMSSPAFIVSPLKNYYYIRTVGWNSADKAMKQNITTIDADTLTYTTMPEVSLNKSSGNGEGTCMIYTKNSFICGMSVSNSDNTANVYLIEVGFDNTSTVLSSSKVSNKFINGNGCGFISGNTIHYIDTAGGDETIVRKIEIGTNITCTNGNRISTDYTTGTRLNIVFTQSGDILFNNYQDTGSDSYKGFWNRITDMSIDNQNNSVLTIDNAHPLPTSGNYTYASGEEVSLPLNINYWKNTSLDFSNNSYTKITSNYGIIIGKDITTTPLEVSNNNEYDYTVINAMLGKDNSRVRLFTIQQKRGWET